MALADAMLPSINTFATNQMLDEKQSEIVRVSSFSRNLRYISNVFCSTQRANNEGMIQDVQVFYMFN